jgi:isopentenyldiphosphate isomerase
MKIQELKKELGITNSDISEFFGLTPLGYANSSAKQRYEEALCSFYAFVKSKREEKNKKEETDK